MRLTNYLFIEIEIYWLEGLFWKIEFFELNTLFTWTNDMLNYFWRRGTIILQGKSTTAIHRDINNEDNCPSAPAEVLRTCAERHTRGLMHPQMLSILTHRQITLPVLMEDDNHREIPSIHHFYRPIRQNIYSILYNMHHHRFMAQKGKGNFRMVYS